VSSLRLANAPVSFGAFELTAAGGHPLPDPDEVLAAIAGAGYEGTELGPPGYLGDASELPQRLATHGLALVAGFVPLRFGQAIERELLPLLDLLEAGRGGLPVLADSGPPKGEVELGGVQRAADLCRARGFEPAFHHHLGSGVETVSEIEALLAGTDVDLVLDTGHLFAAGGDPARAMREWADRIVHVHLKDVTAGTFCELGRGDVDLEAFLAALADSGYDRWLVVEQDRILEPGEGITEAAAAQQRNRRWLERHLEPLQA
jgi:inosose dehydratase